MSNALKKITRLSLLTILLLGILAFVFYPHQKNNYGTETLYQPKQSLDRYEKPPVGFKPIYTELVARHGARGLTTAIKAQTLYDVWQQAKKENALTPLGEKLGPAIQALMTANKKLGYGNLTLVGIQEQEQIAARLYQRMRGLFDTIGDRKIIYVSSSVPRAEESAYYFIQSLGKQDSKLIPLFEKTPALIPNKTDGEEFTPEQPGINDFLLHSNALTPAADKVVSRDSSDDQVYRASLAHQAAVNNPNNPTNRAIQMIASNPKNIAIAQKTLEQLFTKHFINKLATNQILMHDNNNTTHGLLTVTDALYALYAIAPAMQKEYPQGFSNFISQNHEPQLNYLNNDIENFYDKGPSIESSMTTNDAIAKNLLTDFFNEIDAINKGDLNHAAKLRFTHAEVIIPFATLLGLHNISSPMPAGTLYTYTNNPWRGANVAPFAANIQWDVYQGPKHQLLVKMLYNEKETAFKPACNDARYTPNSYFYHYTGLAACYQHNIKPN